MAPTSKHIRSLVTREDRFGSAQPGKRHEPTRPPGQPRVVLARRQQAQKPFRLHKGEPRSERFLVRLPGHVTAILRDLGGHDLVN
jgi:hypothetical protein